MCCFLNKDGAVCGLFAVVIGLSGTLRVWRPHQYGSALGCSSPAGQGEKVFLVTDSPVCSSARRAAPCRTAPTKPADKSSMPAAPSPGITTRPHAQGSCLTIPSRAPALRSQPQISPDCPHFTHVLLHHFSRPRLISVPSSCFPGDHLP